MEETNHIFVLNRMKKSWTAKVTKHPTTATAKQKKELAALIWVIDKVSEKEV